MRGHNQDKVYEHSLDHCLEFFSKSGSLMTKRKAYEPYGDPKITALSLFQAMWCINVPEYKLMAIQLLFWLRDPRGGAGNRSGFRECLTWLANQPGGPAWIRANIDLIPEHGRFDDLKSLFKTPLEKDAAELWVKKILDRSHYALKWAKRDMVPLQRVLKTNEHGLRKIINVPERATVEQKMCANMALCTKCAKMTHHVHSFESGPLVCSICKKTLRSELVPWTELIEYSHVPSVAMKQYAEAFAKHDPEGFAQWKEDLKDGTTKVNASVLFPHNCMQVAHKGDGDLADQLFKALPNYIEASGKRIMVIADTSGSMMSSSTGNSVSPLDVAMSLALYCSDRLGEDNPFYRKFLEFDSTPRFHDWEGKRFQDSLNGGGECGSTNIQAALDYLLKMSKTFGATRETMIDTILIISDMQFDQGARGTDTTAVEQCMKSWEKAGFKRPGIIYWNVAAYAGQPATCDTPNTALISGFSPAIMKAVLEESSFDPMSILRRAIAKYQVRTPKGA